MTAHDLKMAKAAEGEPSWFPATHPLPAANLGELAKGVVVFTPTPEQVDVLIARARNDLMGLATTNVVQRVIVQNPDAMWAIARQPKFAAAAALAPQGFVAFLMLREAGVRQLVSGAFDAANPDPELLTPQNEKPAGIYLWCMHARDGLSAGIPLAFEKMWTPLYRDVDIYARAVTLDGQRFLETIGFTRGATFCGLTTPDLHCLKRSSPIVNELPSYDRQHPAPKAKELSVVVARSIEDIMRVITVRSAVYMSEQECPYLEEFDGNDFCATHLLGYVGAEPAGCLRIRYFADFAKIERLAVRKEFRNTRLAFHIVRAGIDLCRIKGYRVLYGHSQKRLVNFWGHFGFKPIKDCPIFVFSDFDYVEIELNTNRLPHAISIGVDPYVMIRPEGRWHLPGILEKSATRSLARPLVAETST